MYEARTIMSNMTAKQIRENFSNRVRNTNQVVATPVTKLHEEGKISVSARTKFKSSYSAGYTKISDISTIILGVPTEKDGEWFTTDYYIQANLFIEVYSGAELKEILEHAEAKKSTVFNKLKKLGLHKIEKTTDNGTYYKIVDGAAFADSNIAVSKRSFIDGKWAKTNVWVSYTAALDAIQARENDMNNLTNL